MTQCASVCCFIMHLLLCGKHHPQQNGHNFPQQTLDYQRAQGNRQQEEKSLLNWKKRRSNQICQKGPGRKIHPGDPRSAWQGPNNIAVFNTAFTTHEAIQVPGSSPASLPNDLNSYTRFVAVASLRRPYTRTSVCTRFEEMSQF